MGSAWAYVRASEEERDHPQRGVKAQREALKAYAAFRGLRLQKVFVDAEEPAGKPLSARPQGAALLERLAEASRGALLVTRLDRPFGSLPEAVRRCEEWTARGLTLHVLDVEGTPVASDDPLGRFLLAALRTARGLEQVAAQAPRPQRKGKPLLGERVVRGYIVPDEDELRAVQRIQDLASRGKSLRTIAEALDEEGVPTKRRAKAWSKEAIRLILQRIDKGEVRDLRKGS